MVDVPGAEQSAIAALVLVSPDDQVLFAVRDPSANRTYPDAISVPTQRVPPGLAEQLLTDQEERAMGDRETFFSPRWVSNAQDSGHAPLVYVVESILSRKLGVAAALEVGDLDFEARLASETSGVAMHVNVDDPAEKSEPVRMLSIVVSVTRGAGAFPEQTATYSRVGWAPKGIFSRAVRDRDPLLLVPEAHPAEICVQGVCTYAAARLIDAGLV